MHSTILMTMAFDRYIAICNPLRYTTILTKGQVDKLGLLVIGLDLTLIALSYGLIIKAVLRISSNQAHQKALNTCTAHISVVLMYYTPSLFSHLTHRFGQDIALHVHIIFADLYLLIPPMLNPIIYGIRSKELSDKVGKYICRK
ncbi:unnamed protein product [Caretta caretta]